MAHLTAKAVDSRIEAAPAWTVLVVQPNKGRRRQLTQDLRHAGFLVIEANDWSSARTLLAQGDTHIGVIDSSIADLSSLLVEHAADRLDGNDLDGADVPPLIITVDDIDAVDWDSFALLDDTADYVATPISTADLVRRVKALAIKLERRAASREAAEALRAGVRRISASIRATNSPHSITERLVSGIADVFGVPQVGFTTLQDERDPRLSFQCQDGVLLDCDFGARELELATVAAELWRTSGALQLNRGPALAGSEGLTSWALARGTRSLMAVPVGEGDSAFGFIWVGTTDCSRRWSPIEVSLLQHLAGNVAHAMMQGQVITAQQEVLRRLHRLDQAKSDFLETVNHELRTPVTSLMAYLELTLDGVGGQIPRGARDMLRVVERNGKRLQQLIDDVLLISRIAANETKVDWTQVNVPRLLHAICQRMGPAADAGAVTVCSDTTMPEALLEGDAVQLQRVFECLLDNAIKFTPPGGRVDVTMVSCVVDGKPGVDIQVIDTGNGILEDERAEIFTTFYRGSKAQAAAIAGSGLGMTIVRGLVEGHGGSVTVSATAGGGTTVSVKLPVKRVTTDVCPDVSTVAEVAMGPVADASASPTPLGRGSREAHPGSARRRSIHQKLR
jgi:two-component system phosphate regulon sensor histidine kinase PhoR